MLNKSKRALDTVHHKDSVTTDAWKDSLELCIYGDSFADPTNTEMCDPKHLGAQPWPSLLAEYFLGVAGADLSEQDYDDTLRGHSYKGPVEIKGRGGTNLWWSLKNLIADINQSDKIKNVVFVHTNPQRIISLVEPNETRAFLTPQFTHLKDELDGVDGIEHYINLFFKYSHDILLNDTFGQMVFDTVQNLSKKHNFNLVNVMPFRNSGPSIPFLPDVPVVDVRNRAGPVISGLQNICFGESGRPSRYMNNGDFHGCWQPPHKDADVNWEFQGRDLRLCHMNIDNNNLLAQTILDLFNQMKDVDIAHGGSPIIDLYHDGKWVNTKEKWAYYNSAKWIDSDYDYEGNKQ